MSAIAYLRNNGSEQFTWQNWELESNISQLFNELGNADNNKHTVANSLREVNEPFIEEYIQNTIGATHAYQLEHVQTFAIDRPEDRMNYRSNLGDKRLLWHGTKKANIYNILRDGFNLDLAKSSGMFGPGIYFSDCVTKSANYAELNNFWGPRSNLDLSSTGYLFLCEVALGKIKPYTYAANSANKDLGSANSTWGFGHWFSTTAKYCNGTMICPGQIKKSKKRYSLDYNEFIVYYTNQICLKYLVKVRQVVGKQVVTPLYTQPSNNFTFYPIVDITIEDYFPKEELVGNGTDPLISVCIDNIMAVLKPTPRKRPAKKSVVLPPALVKKRGRPRKNPIVNQPAIVPLQNVQVNPIPNVQFNPIPNVQVNPIPNVQFNPIRNFQVNSLPVPVNTYQPQNAPNTSSLQIQLSTLKTSLTHITNLFNSLQQTPVTTAPIPQNNYPSIFPSSIAFLPMPPVYNPVTIQPVILNIQPIASTSNTIQVTTVGTFQNPIVLEDEPIPPPKVSTDPKILNQLLDLYHGNDSNSDEIQKAGTSNNPIIIEDAIIDKNLKEPDAIKESSDSKSTSIGTQNDPILIEDESFPIPNVNKPTVDLDKLFALYHDEADTQPIIGTEENPILIEDVMEVDVQDSAQMAGTQKDPILIDEDEEMPLSQLDLDPTTFSFSF